MVTSLFGRGSECSACTSSEVSMDSDSSSVGLFSSSCRTISTSSMRDNCSNLMAIWSWGVITSCCCSRRFCCNSIAILECKPVSEINFPGSGTGSNDFRRPGFDNLPVVQNICLIANAQSFPDVVVRNQHTNAASGQMQDDFLDIDNRQ